jgi:hypothetical protein
MSSAIAQGSIMSAPSSDHGVFFPEEVELLGRVFEDTLASAKSREGDDLLEGLIASEIIELAKLGERDPQQLQSRTLAKLGRRSGLQLAR